MGVKPTQDLSRRRFLQLGIGGTIVLATSGGIFAWWSAGYSSMLDSKDVPFSLSVKEFAVVRAILDAFFPQADGFPSANSLGLAQRIDEEVWANSDHFRSDLKNGLQLFEHAPSFLGFKGRFTSLSVEERLSFFQQCLTGDNLLLRQLAVGLKQMTHFFYYCDPAVWPLVGYEGPLVSTPHPHESQFAYRKLIEEMRST